MNEKLKEALIIYLNIDKNKSELSPNEKAATTLVTRDTILGPIVEGKTINDLNDIIKEYEKKLLEQERLKNMKQQEQKNTPIVKPTETPIVNSNGNSNINPTVNPTVNSNVKPVVNPTINSNVNSAVNPTVNSNIKPTVNPTLGPTTEEPITINPDVYLEKTMPVQNKPLKKTLTLTKDPTKLNQVGYANVVLMSIIVIIIVAIICAFIFI